MMRRSVGSAFIIACFGVGLILSYQNCSKSFETIEMSKLSSASKASECPRDFVVDILGNCLSPSQATSACQINGQLLADGSAIQTYQSESVPAGSQCQSESRICTGGFLSGTFTAMKCSTLPAPALKTCTFNGITVESGKSVTAYAASSSASCQKEERVCTDGVMSGSFMFSTCIPQGTASCSAADLIVAQRTMIQNINISMNEITAICADGAIPDPKLNLPGVSPMHALRFVNTCGNRACIAKGFTSGRAVEYNANLTILECKTNAIPPNVTTNCQQKLNTMPKLVDMVNVSDAEMAQACPDTPDLAGMTAEQIHIRRSFTCASKACRARGYTAGRLTEFGAGSVTVECSRESIFNELNLGTFAVVLNPTMISVAQTCVNKDQPDPNAFLPTVGGQEAVVFYNTCGRRYCLLQGYQSGGRVLEINNNQASVLCIRQQ